MRVAVFGSGLMGSTIARDLARSKHVDQVTVYDVDGERLRALAERDHSAKLSTKLHDVRKRNETARLLKRFDVGVGALPHGLSEYAISATITAGVDFVDLIFGWRFGQKEIHSAAKRKGITIIPSCGLAPGLTNILAMAATERMDRVDEVHIKVGGIPERPKPPLNYRIVFSFEAVLEEYLRKARIIKNGKITDVPALSGLETIAFHAPIGKCECFYTDGLSTLVQTLRKVREMDEKTIRWPGHAEQIRTLIDCGLLETKPLLFHGEPIAPRKYVSTLLSNKLMLGKEKDLTLLRVDVSGKNDGKLVHHRYEMIDHYDTRHGMTSMARTTAFPCSIATQLVATGRIAQKGLVPPELAFREDLRYEFLDYLASRGMEITSRSI
ncbi:MAG: saccharopine dehydrogenase C-terminal domain-containing protein [Candidatus Bathyarchaeia archaeon]